MTIQSGFAWMLVLFFITLGAAHVQDTYHDYDNYDLNKYACVYCHDRL